MLIPKDDILKSIENIENIQNLLQEGNDTISNDILEKGQRCYKAFMEYEDVYDLWHKARILSIDKLDPIVAILNKHCRNVNISTLVGSSVGVAGGVATIVGLALAPFTAGISLGIMAAGITAGIVGGMTSVGSQLARYGLTKSEMDKVQDKLDDDCQKLNKLQTIIQEMQEMETELHDSWDEDALGRWNATDVSNGVLFGTITRTTGATIAGSISGVTRTVAFAGSALEIAAHTVSAAVIAIDVGIIAFTIYDMVRGSPSEASKKLGQMREQLKNMEEFDGLLHK